MGWHIECHQDILVIPMNELDPEIAKVIREKHSDYIEHEFYSTDGDCVGIHVDDNMPFGYLRAIKAEFKILVNRLRNGEKISEWDDTKNLGYYIVSYCNVDIDSVKEEYPDFDTYFDEDGFIRDDYMTDDDSYDPCERCTHKCQ